MASSHIEHKLALLPDKPGCYIMKDLNAQVIYVGKAKNLKNRVRSYFKSAHTGKTAALVSEIVDFETIITNSDKEAFLLEITLICPSTNIFFNKKSNDSLAIFLYCSFFVTLYAHNKLSGKTALSYVK